MYGPQSGRTAAEKEHFYDDLRREGDQHSMGELVLGMGDFNEHVGKQIKGYEDMHGRNGIVSEKGKRGKLHTVQGEMSWRLTLYWWAREIESI